VAPGAAEPADRIAAARRAFVLLHGRGAVGGEVAEPPRRERLGRERRAFPPELQPRRDVRQ